MKVRFYNFSKKKNSTSQPASTYTSVDCLLKESTSVHDPVLIISGGPNVSHTYAYIPDFDRYYYVEDYVSISAGRTEYVLKEDPMASHKSEIGSTKAYIVYSASQIDRMIPDTRLAVKESRNVAGSGDFNNPVFNSTGCYILSVLAKEQNGAVGIATCYALDQTNMDKVCDWMCDTTVGQAICDFMDGDLKSAILGCIWVPFPMPTTNQNYIKIGDQISTSISVYRFSSFAERTGVYNISCHLRYGATDFRSMEPYTSGNIYLPGVGTMELNMSDWYGSTNINVNVTQEWLTGNCTYLLFNDAGALIQSATCNVASQCPLGQMTTNGSGAVNSLVAGVAGGLLTGNPISVLGGAAGAILNFNRRSPSISGDIGGRSCTLWPYISHCEWSVDTEDPEDLDYITNRGGPCGGVDTISNHTGFLQCEDASVLISGSDQERDEINQILNTGFYYE